MASFAILFDCLVIHFFVISFLRLSQFFPRILYICRMYNLLLSLDLVIIEMSIHSMLMNKLNSFNYDIDPLGIHIFTVPHY